MIKDIKNGLTNLSMHLQRYKPTEWNTFFELAMDIKIVNNFENLDIIDKSLTTENNNQYDSLTTIIDNSNFDDFDLEEL